MSEFDWHELQDEAAELWGDEPQPAPTPKKRRPSPQDYRPRLRIDYSEMPSCVPVGSELHLEPVEPEHLNLGDLILLPRGSMPVMGRFLACYGKTLHLAKEGKTEAAIHQWDERYVMRVFSAHYQGRPLNVGTGGLSGWWGRLTHFGTRPLLGKLQA
ncbi:MAG: hypothetical protein AB7S38_10810 [Vulcanimicrobiota bacterium]